MHIILFALLLYVVLQVVIQIMITICEEGGCGWLLLVIVVLIGFGIMAM